MVWEGIKLNQLPALNATIGLVSDAAMIAQRGGDVRAGGEPPAFYAAVFRVAMSACIADPGEDGFFKGLLSAFDAAVGFGSYRAMGAK
jgi:hypothetical protein